VNGASAPRVLIFDSGVGGLSVAAAVRRHLPKAELYYLADRARFPYGALADRTLISRVISLMGGAIERLRPDAVVIACNTASTLMLVRLRQRFPVPFVGTVPAIKPAVAMTRSGIVGVLATPATVARDYTRRLIADFAGGVDLVLHGAEGLAMMAEDKAAGRTLDPAALAASVAPVFAEMDGRRTDTVVLGCTHYPLLMPELTEAAPWPVAFLDPADAIARRVVEVTGWVNTQSCDVVPGTALLTAAIEPGSRLGATFAEYGFARVEHLQAEQP